EARSGASFRPARSSPSREPTRRDRAWSARSVRSCTGRIRDGLAVFRPRSAARAVLVGPLLDERAVLVPGAVGSFQRALLVAAAHPGGAVLVERLEGAVPRPRAIRAGAEERAAPVVALVGPVEPPFP